MKKFEFFEHTADVGIKAFGDTLESSFEAAAEAMFSLISDGAEIHGEEIVGIEVESIDDEGLLVSFLSELIVIFETDNLVLTEFDVRFPAENRLVGWAKGEKFDANKHGEGIQVKGVSYHMLEIDRAAGDSPARVQVLFDV